MKTPKLEKEVIDIDEARILLGMVLPEKETAVPVTAPAAGPAPASTVPNT